MAAPGVGGKGDNPVDMVRFIGSWGKSGASDVPVTEFDEELVADALKCVAYCFSDENVKKLQGSLTAREISQFKANLEQLAANAKVSAKDKADLRAKIAFVSRSFLSSSAREEALIKNLVPIVRDVVSRYGKSSFFGNSEGEVTRLIARSGGLLFNEKGYMVLRFPFIKEGKGKPSEGSAVLHLYVKADDRGNITEIDQLFHP